MVYRKRIVDDSLTRLLAVEGAVVIEGPKACGKTETARQAARSEVLLDTDRQARQAIAIDPSLVLEGGTPRLIDEWQVEPVIWNHVRRAIDDRRLAGQFILTGSAIPSDDITRHSGAGRLARLRMRPMSLAEMGHSSGEISLAELMQGTPARSSAGSLPVRRLAELIAVGGWPALLERPVDHAVSAVRSYLDEIRRVDVGGIDGRQRDPDKVGRVLRSLGRNVGTFASLETLASDVGGTLSVVDPKTVAGYHSILERLMIVEDQPAWAPHLRSRSILRQKPRRHFVDPSLAVAALRADPDRLLADLNLLGLLFESLVVRDMRIYGEAMDGEVLQYRDNTGLEVDVVLDCGHRRWAAFEVKLGGGLIEEGAASLKRFAARIDTGRAGEPAVLGVIVGEGYGYVRPDGISVIPIGALRP